MANVRVKATATGFRLGRRYRPGQEFVMPERETFRIKKDAKGNEVRVPLSWVAVLGPAGAPPKDAKPEGVQDVYAGSSEDAARRAEEAARKKLEEMKESAEETEEEKASAPAKDGNEPASSESADADIDGLV